MEPDDNSFANLYQMIVRDGIENLMDANEFSRFFIPFKELADKEKKRYIDETSE
jgi:hypothetical protein